MPFVMFFWIAPYVRDKTIDHDFAMSPTPHQMEQQRINGESSGQGGAAVRYRGEQQKRTRRMAGSFNL